MDGMILDMRKDNKKGREEVFVYVTGIFEFETFSWKEKEKNTFEGTNIPVSASLPVS